MIVSKNRRNFYIRKPKGKEGENPSRPSFVPPFEKSSPNFPFHTIPYPLIPPFLKGARGI